jgi:hypothetical protein
MKSADQAGIEIQSCAEDPAIGTFGISPGKCIDDELISRLFNVTFSSKKDPGQRKTCRCVSSKDIGMTNTCMHGCPYCYATTSDAAAEKNFSQHDPESESLV